MASSTHDSISVSGLFTYPVKSCKAHSLHNIDLDKRGIIGDRRFMIVNDNGRFLTQREYSTMAQILPALDLSNRTLRLESPTMPPITVDYTEHETASHLVCDVVVWGDTCRAVRQHADVSAWLSQFLGVSCHLVVMEYDFARIVDQEYAVRPTDETSFSDGFPILLISEASLTNLNDRLVQFGNAPVPMSRFRPNLVVRGTEPFAEDSWKRIRIGSVELSVVKPCARCIVTTIDQESGTKTGAEPIATLKKFRRNADGTKVFFGQNVIHTTLGTVRLGDTVEILE